MSSRLQDHLGDIDLATFVQFSLQKFAPEPLCQVAIEAYKKNRSKSKAVAIYEVFCNQTAPLGVDAQQYTLPESKYGSRLCKHIEDLIAQRRCIGKLKSLARCWTDKSQEPGETLFDQLEDALFGVGKNKNVFADMKAKITNPNTETPNNVWSSYASTIVKPSLKTLLDAGFTLDELKIKSLALD